MSFSKRLFSGESNLNYPPVEKGQRLITEFFRKSSKAKEAEEEVVEDDDPTNENTKGDPNVQECIPKDQPALKIHTCPQPYSVIDSDNDTTDLNKSLKTPRPSLFESQNKKRQLSVLSSDPTSPYSSDMPQNSFLSSLAPAENQARFNWLEIPLDSQKRPPDHPDYDPSTLYIPPSQFQKLTPFEKQYWEIKATNYDLVIFFKKGKFYELYEKDADIGARHFGLKPTARVNMRMVGVPEATFDSWVMKFVDAGYRVGKVDQSETAISKTIREKENSEKTEEKIIRRELVSVYTQGTLADPSLLTEYHENVCCALSSSANEPSVEMNIGICVLDASVSTLGLKDWREEKDFRKLANIIVPLRPKEILIESLNQSLVSVLKVLCPEAKIIRVKKEEFPKESMALSAIKRATIEVDLNAFGCNSISALGAIVFYLEKLKISNILSESKATALVPPTTTTNLDYRTVQSLELFANSYDFTEAGTLFEFINHCATSSGKRLLRNWLMHPLASHDLIIERQKIVAHILDNESLRLRIQAALKSSSIDLPRHLARILQLQSKPKSFFDVLKYLKTLAILSNQLLLDDSGSALLVSIGPVPDILPQVTTILDSYSMANNPKGSYSAQVPDIVPIGNSDPELNRLQADLDRVVTKINDYKATQEKILGITGIVFKDLGKELFQMEIPDRIENIPADYIQMSKTKAVRRYWTPDLRALVQDYVETRERISMSSSVLFTKVCKNFGTISAQLKHFVEYWSLLDCYCSLATASCSFVGGRTGCFPTFIEEPPTRSMIKLKNSRHPCLERIASSFISNDIELSNSPSSVSTILLTGPNMGGKSTLLRQVCVTIILAQIGMQVPADSCTLTVFDQIFTRMGASDNIGHGQSTFMKELFEASTILNDSTSHSFVCIDELGRGTGTFDGLTISFSTLYYILAKIGPLMLFSTHFNQLASIFANGFPSVAVGHMSFSQIGTIDSTIVFLYKLILNSASSSYGITVAKMSGLKEAIINRAIELSHSRGNSDSPT